MDKDLLVVGLGASAGGVQAFRTFFENVPPDSGMAYVVVLHLSPEHDSRLAEVLQAVSRIPVSDVGERVRVEANHAYVVSPRQGLAMLDGQLVQSDMLHIAERRAPIDAFFRTLAESHDSHAACVLLSGTGADGSMRLKRIKERGGLCLVQDPAEAEYPDMPRNALATGLADAVLPVAEIPSRLIAYRNTLRRLVLPEEPQHRHAPDERALHELFTQLRAKTGHDFSNYKRATVLRRIARRMGVRQAADLAAYLELLRGTPEEAQALLKDLLISVTNFFRDAKAFEALEEEVIPKLFENKGDEGQVRVWVPACATGEEAYSIAMLLAEYASAVPESPSIQIFATDIDEDAIAVAREGAYTLNDAADVSPERLRRFFVKEGSRYQIRKDLREMVLFAKHNLIKDPPFSHLDLISCRNLLIYLNRAAQQRATEVMHFALDAGGFLFLGTSESLEGAGDLFVSVNKEAHIYQTRGGPARIGVPVVPQEITDLAERRRPAEPVPLQRTVRERLAAPDLHQRLLEQYAPPSVIVNEEHEIIHLSDHAGRYMQMAGGEPSTSLIKAIRPELRLELRTALYQAAQNRSNVEARGQVLRIDDRTVRVKILVRPVLRESDPARGFFLVLFEETRDDAQEQATEPTVQSGEPALQMEEELTRLKAQLRLTVEQYETQAEELKASNEELQAINEELRSATEELETSKEELQSLNEELRTVNQELKVKIEEQAQASNDVQNLINSTDIGTVFLDRMGRIKLFTPRARDIFNLISSDRGRPLEDLSGHLLNVELHEDVDRVLERLERVEREVCTKEGRWYLMRIVPYRTSDDRIDGVVLTFVDITERKHATERVAQSEERLRRALEVETIGVVFFGRDMSITDANDAFLRISGYTREDVQKGRVTWDLLTPPALRPQLSSAWEELQAAGRTVPYEMDCSRPNGTRWTALFAATRLSDAEYVAFMIDVTERQRAVEALRNADRRKNEFLATLAHELRNPLAPISTSLQLLSMPEIDDAMADRARKTIERQVSHMVRLVEDLLEVSRITLGRIELRRQPVDIGSLLRTVIESVKPEISSGRYELTVDITSERTIANADFVRLSQVFVNLLNNALKYTDEGGRIEVRATREGDSARVSVKDSGIGISAEMLPHVFELFAQGHEMPAGHSQSGLGIGLTLVRTLVEAHGGSVEVASGGPRQGTEFVVRLPLSDDAEPPAVGQDGRVDLTGHSVLVVDDNRDAAASLGVLLSRFGADVRVVYSGKDALAAVETRRPSLVLLDIGMPLMDGLEVARRIRAMEGGSGVRIVALTGWGQHHDREAALAAGFDHHLTKPLDMARLREIVSSIFGLESRPG